MNIIFFILIAFSLQFICLLAGRKAARNVQDKQDYFLAGKKVSLFPLMMTFLATQIGGGLALGSAEEAYTYGWSVLFLPIGSALGLLFLGLGIGRRLAQFPVSTVAHILELVYRSRLLRMVASLLSILSLFMILIAQIIASQKFLASMGVENTSLFILFWAIVIFYTVQGGLKAVIATDLIQAMFFIAAFILCFALVNIQVPETSIQAFAQKTTFPPSIWGWLLMPLLFMTIEQDMGQRCFAGRSGSIVSKSALLAGLCTLAICTIPIFLGIFAKVAGLEKIAGQSILMSSVSYATNPWVASIVGCAILAAIISTADSLINAISSNLSHDFKLPFLEKNNVKVIRSITALISIAAMIFSFYLDGVVSLLIQSYELSVSCLFVPIFIALFKKRGHFLSALLSMLCGMLGFVIFKFYIPPMPKELLTLALSFIGYGVGETVSYYFLEREVLKDNGSLL